MIKSQIKRITTHQPIQQQTREMEKKTCVESDLTKVGMKAAQRHITTDFFYVHISNEATKN